MDKHSEMPMRQDTAKQYRHIRKLLKGNEPISEPITTPGTLYSALMLAGCIILAAVFVLCFMGKAHAETISSNQATKAIIGEAENQGAGGMLAVSCAIRNRGTLKGVYGLNAPRVVKHKYSQDTYDLAQVMWIESEADKSCDNFIHGANSWENIKAFGKPSWADKCQETVRVKDHVFYKC